jgi:hypothetical protein
LPPRAPVADETEWRRGAGGRRDAEGGERRKPPPHPLPPGDGVSPLTNGDDEEHEQEGVEHGRDGRGEAGYDIPKGAESAEDADDAECPHHAQDGDGHVDGAEGEEGEEHHHGVNEVVGVPEKGREPVGVDVHRELEREEKRKGHVRGVEKPAGLSEGAVRGGQPAVKLRLGGVDDEVLRARGGRAEGVRGCGWEGGVVGYGIQGSGVTRNMRSTMMH